MRSKTERQGWMWGALAALGVAGMANTAYGQCPDKLWSAMIIGQQEVPPVATEAEGCARFVLDTDANTLSYHIVYYNLSAPETAAHIHVAPPGSSGGVVHPLPAGTLKVGVWNYPESQEADILAGNMYVNIHSANFPSGEIRGQIVNLNAVIDAGQEVPPNASTAEGWGVFMIDTDANTLSYHIEFAGLTSNQTAAHIHGFGAHLNNRGVVHGLGTGTPKIGSWTYDESQEASILDGLGYVNIHTANFGGGEIRGQVTPIIVPIDESQEVPPTSSPATGCGLISFDREKDVLGYDIRRGPLQGNESAAHIHGFTPPGGNAGVLHGLGVGVRKLGTWLYAPNQEVPIGESLTYINIHSSLFGGGEIRGQINFPSTVTCETICPAEADDFEVSAFIGGPVSGDALDTCERDEADGTDGYLTQLNQLPVSVIFPFAQIDVWGNTTIDSAAATSVGYELEWGVTALVPGGQNADTMRTLIRRYANGSPYMLVDTRAAGGAFVDEIVTHTQAADAPDFVQAADGEVRVRAQAFNPGDALNAAWVLRIDFYQATVKR